MGRLGRLGLEQPLRYERSRPGKLLHVDLKQLGRVEGGAGKRVRGGARQHKRHRASDAAGVRRNLIGWEYVHVAVDDYSRLAYAEVLADQKASTAAGFLRRRFLPPTRDHRRTRATDNGGRYRATIHALACRTLGIRHLRTRPYRPQTNGKAEGFIRTLINGWA